MNETESRWNGISLDLDPWGYLTADRGDGKPPLRAQAIRAFPISDPTHGIALCDDNGKELAWFDSLEGLPEPFRRLIEDDLARRQFLPVLQRIIRISSPNEPSEWEVVTDRGPTSFTLASQEHVRRLTNNRVLVLDAQGIRYFIPDLRNLDAGSQRLLDRYF